MSKVVCGFEVPIPSRLFASSQKSCEASCVKNPLASPNTRPPAAKSDVGPVSGPSLRHTQVKNSSNLLFAVSGGVGILGNLHLPLVAQAGDAWDIFLDAHEVAVDVAELELEVPPGQALDAALGREFHLSERRSAAAV